MSKYWYSVLFLVVMSGATIASSFAQAASPSPITVDRGPVNAGYSGELQGWVYDCFDDQLVVIHNDGILQYTLFSAYKDACRNLWPKSGRPVNGPEYVSFTIKDGQVVSLEKDVPRERGLIDFDVQLWGWLALAGLTGGVGFVIGRRFRK